ncbi:MAG: putative metallo-hydrolase [Chlamydiae bacterium]|nr:putative metallo-hydrolase [Chlamydiota bacterium]
MAILEGFACGPFQTNAYLLACSDTQKGVFIDPAPESCDLLTRAATGYEMEAILLTHSHWDHIADVKKLKRSFALPLYVHPADSENVRTPGSDGLPLLIPVEGVEPDHDLVDGQILEVGELRLRVIHTPGHSPGGVCFYLEKEKILISGDTLFKGSIGNLSFPTADPSAMWKSLKKLEELPPETRVYSGHGPSTSIGVESWLPQAKELFS